MPSRTFRCRVLSPLLGAPLLAAIAAAQQTLYEINGTSYGDNFGHACALIGDVDGDGRSEIVVGAPFDDSSGNDAGKVQVRSGSSGAVLYELSGSAGARFGHAVCGVSATSTATVAATLRSARR